MRRDAGCANASLGFAMIEIGAPYFHLSKWNDRQLNNNQLNKVVKNMFGEGCHYKRLANAIPVIVHRKEVNLGSLVGPQAVPDGLKTVVWLERGETVEVANGRHRTESHKVFVAKVQKKLEAAENELAKRVRMKATAEAIKEATDHRDHEKAYLESLGEWIAQFYDYGERFYHHSPSAWANFPIIIM